jgi:hypothetical protein
VDKVWLSTTDFINNLDDVEKFFAKSETVTFVTFVTNGLHYTDMRTVEDLAESYPEVELICNKGNKANVTVSLNQGLRAFLASDVGVKLFTSLEQVIDFPTHALEKVGVVDGVFQEKFWLMDYVFRCELAGILVNIPHEILFKDLDDVQESWDMLKFGTKWNIPTDTQPTDFWEYLHDNRYEWKEDMKCL